MLISCISFLVQRITMHLDHILIALLLLTGQEWDAVPERQQNLLLPLNVGVIRTERKKLPKP